jgi:hypothetical protein
MPKDSTLQTTASGDTSRGPTQQGATPAPWCVKSFNDSEEIWPVDGGEDLIATIDQAFPRQIPQAKANARLIAQSPALLAAAKAFVAWVDDVWGSAALSPKTLQDYENAKAAIQAAEGSDRP